MEDLSPTVGKSLAYADRIRQWIKDNPAEPDMPLSDFHVVILADELRRLREQGVCAGCGTTGALCDYCH